MLLTLFRKVKDDVFRKAVALVTTDMPFHANIATYLFLDRGSRQAENKSQDQNHEKYCLPVMQYDREPVTVEAFTGPGHYPAK